MEVHIKFNSLFLLFLGYLTEYVKPPFAELFIMCLLECNYVIHTYMMQAHRNQAPFFQGYPGPRGRVYE